jgi:PAS domain-containing protein
MSEHNLPLRGRTFLAGKIISNFGQSSIDCIIRRISDDGATIEVESAFGVPEHFHLRVSNEDAPRPCQRKWQSEKQIGVAFETVEAGKTARAAKTDAPVHPERRGGDGIVRGQLLALRAALDEMDVGVVLLDHDLRSQFINRAFRRMWALPDAVADRHPPFITLMYHGRDTNAYQVPADELDPISPNACGGSVTACRRRSICAAPTVKSSAWNAPCFPTVAACSATPM